MALGARHAIDRQQVFILFHLSRERARRVDLDDLDLVAFGAREAHAEFHVGTVLFDDDDALGHGVSGLGVVYYVVAWVAARINTSVVAVSGCYQIRWLQLELRE